MGCSLSSLWALEVRISDRTIDERVFGTGGTKPSAMILPATPIRAEQYIRIIVSKLFCNRAVTSGTHSDSLPSPPLILPIPFEEVIPQASASPLAPNKSLNSTRELTIGRLEGTTTEELGTLDQGQQCFGGLGQGLVMQVLSYRLEP
ncbi:unnamed protein product [Fusarium venenatum]|uniref:Uncharacterized protein n=1 Tax=Fusarium venenatum TaxID=56646 RepID=A0A2L2T1L0_9HYPO|nr:uncharacterized protein FVRRES_00976 [Fusarium venenatum]CEI64464.1 unnamed protein product [Fusarium venenatum]